MECAETKERKNTYNDPSIQLVHILIYPKQRRPKNRQRSKDNNNNRHRRSANNTKKDLPLLLRHRVRVPQSRLERRRRGGRGWRRLFGGGGGEGAVRRVERVCARSFDVLCSFARVDLCGGVVDAFNSQVVSHGGVVIGGEGGVAGGVVQRQNS